MLALTPRPPTLEQADDRLISSPRVQRLKEYLRLDKVPANSTGAGAVWLQWAATLSRSVDDPNYRMAFDQILSDIGCSNSNYGMAIGSLATPNSYDFYGGGYYEVALPEPPPDPSLGKIRDFRDPNPLDFGSFSMYPTAINPIPDWADLRPLSKALKAGQCAASKELPPDFLSKLDILIALRVRNRGSAVK